MTTGRSGSNVVPLHPREPNHAVAIGVLLASIVLAGSPPARAAYLENVAQRLVQPDGSVVAALATGDEFNHRLHDAAGFTIVQDPLTGWFVYAERGDGELRPTALRPGWDDPDAAGLEPNLLKPRSACRAVDEPIRELVAESRSRALGSVEAQAVTGTLGNLVVFIRFSDQPEFGSTIGPWETVFNGSLPARSVKTYFEEASYGQMSFQTLFLPPPAGGMVVSYQDSHPRSYFSPYNEVTNPGGYRTTADPTTSVTYREHTLLRDAILAVESQLPPGAVLDTNGDGQVDAVTFVVQGAYDGWSDLLWPHAWALYTHDVRLGGKRVYRYNFGLEPAGEPSPTYNVFCHELGHVIGFPDLYHYSHDGLVPVGPWDMMHGNTVHFGAHMKWRYPGWIGSIPEITASGTYSLAPLTSPSSNALRIASPVSADEYFVLEYRRKAGLFEGSLPTSGLLVYRINPAEMGNAGGPPDEVYVYRPGGAPTEDGDVFGAAHSAESGRTALDATTDPVPFLGNGALGGLRIFDVGPAGDTITFNVEILPACYSVARSAMPAGAGTVDVSGTWSCAGGYLGGSTVGLSAQPAAGATFLGWAVTGGTVSSVTSAATSFTISTAERANPTITATFSLDATPETQLTLGVPREDTTRAAGTMAYFYAIVPSESAIFSVDLAGTADLYVSLGTKPTASSYACRKRAGDPLPHACSFTGAAPGVWWVGVSAVQAGLPITVTAAVSSGIPSEERAALIALWNATEGTAWLQKTGWRNTADTDFAAPGTECSWYGVSCGGSPTRVTAIRLPLNDLRGLLPDLSALSALQVLDLSSNSSMTAAPVPAWLGSLGALRELRMRSTNRNGTIPDLSGLASLEVLDLARNTSLTADAIPAWLSASSGLRELDLYYTNRNGSIPDLSAAVGLEVLELGYNPGLAAGPVPTWLSALTSLRVLGLYYANRNGLMPDLSGLTRLEVLDLGYNTGLTAGPIPAWLGTLPALYDLDLSGTNRTGPIPAALGSLPSLIYLSLANNQLSGGVPEELRAPNLWWAFLENNLLTGPLPRLDNVRAYVFLGNNSFDPGPVPEWLLSKNLYGLDMRNTNRTGTVPAWLGSMTYLNYLYLGGNQLGGPVPGELAGLTRLYSTGLDLRWNALHTSDAALRTFVNGKSSGGDFEATQTIAPTGVAVGGATATSLTVSWTPIRYTADGGGYRVYRSTASGGPYSLSASVAGKGSASATITGLSPETEYFFVVEAYTAPHGSNRNPVVSERSAEVSGTTGVNCPPTPTASSNSPVCAGATLNLTTPTVSGATYAWTGPGGFTSTLQNPTRTGATTAMAGTYDVTITTNGCTSAPGATSVVVNAIPATPTASSNSPICAGATLNLTTPTVPGATYAWTGPGGFTSTLQNPIRTDATIAMAGTYNVTVTTNGCTSAPGATSVVVNAIPATPTASSNSPICAGATLNLTTPTVSGATYAWTGPGGFTSTLQNPTRTGATIAMSGTYNVTVTTNACTSAAGSTSVVVNAVPASPTAASNSPVAAGATIQLTASTVTGATFSWTGPEGFTSTQQNPTIPNATAVRAGTYSVTATVNGCTSAAATMVVAVSTSGTLTVVRAGAGSGTVASGPAGIACGSACSATFPASTSVTLTATPGTGSRFAGWSGAGCTGLGACTVSVAGAMTVQAMFLPATPVRFYSLTPCRVVDTRNPAGPFGGPALAAGSTRTLPLGGACNVPADAAAVSLNVTVADATEAGTLTMYPGTGPAPGTNTITFVPGKNRANNVTMGLVGGNLTVVDYQVTGTVNLIIDVNGYYR